MADGFARVAANPYSWPFDGRWSADDSAMLVLGFQNGTVTALDAKAELRSRQHWSKPDVLPDCR